MSGALDWKAARGRPRLLVINNMPAYYRTLPFAELIGQFEERTGGAGLVAYQVRRDSTGRGEWFFTQDEDLPYPHHYSSANTRPSTRITGYPLRLDVRLWRDYRPTHLFAAGWDSPLSVSAALFARLTRTRLGVWVESNPSTSRLRGGLSDQYRRRFLRSASFAVVPTPASAEYVGALAATPLATIELKNPVDWPRLRADSAVPGARRMIFLGDLSLRKGFDHLCRLLDSGAEDGWSAIAWGRDVEGLAAQAPANLRVEAARPLSEVVPLLRASDVLVIPSRVDPAPLTYSEALALGLRTLVSDRIAYAVDADRGAGTRSIDASDPAGTLAAARALLAGPRPDGARGEQVQPAVWAAGVLGALISEA